MQYAAQVIPQIDAEIAEKGHFSTETRWFLLGTSHRSCIMLQFPVR